MIGERARAEDFDRVVTTTTKHHAFVFVKDVIPRSTQSLAWEAWGDVADFADPSVTRRAAAGAPDVDAFRRFERFRDIKALVPATATTAHVVTADGRTLRQPMSNPVRSYLAGYGVDRFNNKARANMLTHRWPDRWRTSLPFFNRVDDVMATLLPHAHKLMRDRAMTTHPHWRVGDTAFSSVTINVDYESRYHRDLGDFVNGWSALTVVEQPSYTGGLYVMPEHRIAVDVRAGDVLMTQSHITVHGNTEIVKANDDARRVSFVCYLKDRLAIARNRLEAP